MRLPRKAGEEWRRRCLPRTAMNIPASGRTSLGGGGGKGRAIGTVLAGPALEAIQAGKAYYGNAPILGTPYITGYEPIKDASGAVIGVYFVGYSQSDLDAMVEGRLAYAKTLLGITADQASAWKAYEDASRANVQSLQAAHEARLAAEGSPIDRMHAQT